MKLTNCNVDPPVIGIPDGYVLIKKGGRPPRTLRDIAVFIARLIKLGEFGKGYLADDWVIKYFGLNDSGHVRKARKNAKRVLTKRWIAMSMSGEAMWLFPAKKTPENYVYVEAGTVGWAWVDGLAQAVEAKVINNTPMPGPGAAGGDKFWAIDASKHGC